MIKWLWAEKIWKVSYCIVDKAVDNLRLFHKFIRNKFSVKDNLLPWAYTVYNTWPWKKRKIIKKMEGIRLWLGGWSEGEAGLTNCPVTSKKSSSTKLCYQRWTSSISSMCTRGLDRRGHSHPKRSPSYPAPVSRAA